MKNRMKKGISLITLIITIIVIVILAVAIILNLNSTNMISNAKKAKLQNDFSVLKDELTLYHADQFLKDDYAGFGKYEAKLLDAGYGSGSGISTEKGIEYNGVEKSGTIYDILTNLNKTDFDKRVVISDGEIVFVDEEDPYNPENFDKNNNNDDNNVEVENDPSDYTVVGELRVRVDKMANANSVNINISYPYKTLEEIQALSTGEKEAKILEVENKNNKTTYESVDAYAISRGYDSLQDMYENWGYANLDEFVYDYDYFFEYSGSGWAVVTSTNTSEVKYMNKYDEPAEFKVTENGSYVFECVDENDSNLKSTVTVVVDEIVEPTVYTDEAKDSNVNEVYSYKYPKLPEGFEYINNTVSNWERTVENNTYVRKNYNDGLLIRNKTTNKMYVWVPVKPEQYEEYFVNFYTNSSNSNYFDNMSDTEKAEYNAIKDSVNTYGGFYIASNLEDARIDLNYSYDDGCDEIGIWSQGLSVSRAVVKNNDTVASSCMYIPQLKALTSFLSTGRYGDLDYSEHRGFYSEEEAFSCSSKNINNIYTSGATLLSDLCASDSFCCFGGVDVVSWNYTSNPLDNPYDGAFDNGYSEYHPIAIRTALYLK